jgi:hypothetical protein
MRSSVSIGGKLRQRVERHGSLLMRHSESWLRRAVRAETAVVAAELEREVALGRVSAAERDMAREELGAELVRLMQELRRARQAYWANLPSVH